MKKMPVPRCRINENLFIIDFTPTEDAADNRFGLNSEKTVTLLAIAFQRLLVVTCRNCRSCQKIFVALRCYKMKKNTCPSVLDQWKSIHYWFHNNRRCCRQQIWFKSWKKTPTNRQSLFLSDLWPESDSSAAWCKLWKQTGTFGTGTFWHRDLLYLSHLNDG